MATRTKRKASKTKVSRKGKVGRPKGYKVSAATKKKISLALKRAWKSGEHKGNTKKGSKKRVHSGSKTKSRKLGRPKGSKNKYLKRDPKSKKKYFKD